MDSLQALRERLAPHKKDWAKIAQLGGVPESTFNKLAYGYTNARSSTVDKVVRGLEVYLSQPRQ